MVKISRRQLTEAEEDAPRKWAETHSETVEYPHGYFADLLATLEEEEE